jgi:predicted RNA-binding protein
MRPEVVHYRKNLKARYTKPKQAEILLLIPQSQTKPFHKSREYKQIAKLLNNEPRENLSKVHMCFYAAPFGVIPIELDETYPLSQHETVQPLDKETITYVANQIGDYINRTNYKTIILLDDPENWNKTILNACKKICQQKKAKFKSFNTKKARSTRNLRLALKT